MTKLRECPFCGVVPEIDDRKSVQCSNRRCPLILAVTLSIHDWNTRPTHPMNVEALEALHRMIGIDYEYSMNEAFEFVQQYGETIRKALKGE